jgi:hypothetical protein
MTRAAAEYPPRQWVRPSFDKLRTKMVCAVEYPPSQW